jgi:hypothetical protein
VHPGDILDWGAEAAESRLVGQIGPLSSQNKQRGGIHYRSRRRKEAKAACPLVSFEAPLREEEREKER